VALFTRDHYDPDYLRAAARRELAKHAHLTDDAAVRAAVVEGRWHLREEQGRARFKRYRHLRERYGHEAQEAEFAADSGAGAGAEKPLVVGILTEKDLDRINKSNNANAGKFDLAAELARLDREG